MRLRTRSESGFTLIELMLTVALIGVMSAIAIPNFIAYQARSRQAEAYTNLDSLARAYHGYYAESGIYPDMGIRSGEPSLPPAPLLGSKKMSWTNPQTTQDFFDIVGWGSEGDVYYTYDVVTAESGACTCTAACFTATAHGDVDSDGGWSALMYAKPQTDAAGGYLGECPSAIGGYFAPKYGEVVWRPGMDRY